jgi:hypothetical protein
MEKSVKSAKCKLNNFLTRSYANFTNLIFFCLSNSFVTIPNVLKIS